jgi:sec-independent protein translocase protein TatB
MFGIGLPEMIVIFAVALIVVGPDKLPGLARSLAKGIMEMKKTLNQVKENLTEEGEVLNSVQTDLQKTAEELRGKMIDVDPTSWQLPPTDQVQDKNKDSDIIDLQPIAVPYQDKPLLAADIKTDPIAERTSAEAALTSHLPADSSPEKRPAPPKVTNA